MSELSDELLSEHQGCLKLINDVEIACRRERNPAWAEVLHERMHRLRHALEAHFRSEEQGPLFRKVSKAYPRFADQLNRLRAEHAVLLYSFDAACVEARGVGAQGTRLALGALAMRVRAVLASLRRHEAEENEVILRVQMDDLRGWADEPRQF